MDDRNPVDEYLGITEENRDRLSDLAFNTLEKLAQSVPEKERSAVASMILLWSMNELAEREGAQFLIPMTSGILSAVTSDQKRGPSAIN